MSEFYKYEFVSAEPMYAEIKEKLKTYFDSGAIDDVMFPVWTKRCIDRFRRSLYRIETAVLNISGYEAPLPDDFKYVREAWLCTNIHQYIQMPMLFIIKKIAGCLLLQMDVNLVLLLIIVQSPRFLVKTHPLVILV